MYTGCFKALPPHPEPKWVNTYVESTNIRGTNINHKRLQKGIKSESTCMRNRGLSIRDLTKLSN